MPLAVSRDNDGDDYSSPHSIAFAQLVAYLEEMNSDKNSAPSFKVTDIVKLCKTGLEQLGLTVDNQLHTTRLKNRLLLEIPYLKAYSPGREILLSFEKDIGPTVMIVRQN